MNNDHNVLQNIKRKTILRLFPYLKNKEKAMSLKIDDDSLCYISIREYAAKISNIVKKHLKIINIEPYNAIVTDATAGVGGDTISFAQSFKFIYAIEMNKERAEFLTNNINVYELRNVKIYNEDCTQLLNLIPNHDAIFIDPPWEPDGEPYQNHETIRLPLGNNYSLEEYCNKLMDPNFMKCVPKLLIIKLPKNYDTLHFYKTVKNRNMYYYDLKKMIILVVVI
jgi:tRNA G37 N-methylase Trm5